MKQFNYIKKRQAKAMKVFLKAKEDLAASFSFAQQEFKKSGDTIKAEEEKQAYLKAHIQECSNTLGRLGTFLGITEKKEEVSNAKA